MPDLLSRRCIQRGVGAVGVDAAHDAGDEAVAADARRRSAPSSASRDGDTRASVGASGDSARLGAGSRNAAPVAWAYSRAMPRIEKQ